MVSGPHLPATPVFRRRFFDPLVFRHETRRHCCEALVAELSGAGQGDYQDEK